MRHLLIIIMSLVLAFTSFVGFVIVDHHETLRTDSRILLIASIFLALFAGMLTQKADEIYSKRPKKRPQFGRYTAPRSNGNDPMERMIHKALSEKGIRFQTESQIKKDGGAALDFYLPDEDVYIEVKQFHSPRSGAQLEKAPNIILAQGRQAVTLLATLLNKS